MAFLSGKKDTDTAVSAPTKEEKLQQAIDEWLGIWRRLR